MSFHSKMPQIDEEKSLIMNMKDFMQVSESEKLNLIMVAINKVNINLMNKMSVIETALLDEEDGVFPRLVQCET